MAVRAARNLFVGQDRLIEQSLDLLLYGLLEDLGEMIAVMRVGGQFDWGLAAVVGDFPKRRRPSYDPRFVRRLVGSGFELFRKADAGWQAPDCLIEYVLMVWVADRAELLADTNDVRLPASWRAKTLDAITGGVDRWPELGVRSGARLCDVMRSLDQMTRSTEDWFVRVGT